MVKEGRYVFFSLLIACVAFAACACGRKEYKTIVRDDGTSFRSTVYELYHKTSTDKVNDIIFVGAMGDDTVVANCVEDKLIVDIIDSEGNVLNAVTLGDEWDHSFCIKGRNVYIINGSKVYCYNADASSLDIIADDLPTGVYKVCPTDNGFIGAFGDEVVLFSDRFEPLKTVKTEFEPSYFHPLIVRSDGYYAVEDLFPGVNIYRLDFDSESYEPVCSGDEIGAGQSTFYGNYYLKDDKLISLDVSSRTMNVVADFNNMIVPVQSRALARDMGLFVSDDNTFFRSYVYYDGHYDIIRFEHDSSIDYSSREKIRIAGYGTKQDFALMHAVSAFNGSQDRFFAVVEDYTDNYKYGDSAEAQKCKTEIMTRYSKEGMPDILYGNDNDYQYMGRNGMVIDMSGYITDDISGNMTESIRNIMLKPNATYEVFSSYMLAGYWGKASKWGTGNISYVDAEKKADELNEPLYCSLFSYDIVDMAVRYETEYLLDNNIIPDTGEFELLLKHAVKYGLATDEPMTVFNDVDGLRSDQYLLARFMDTRAASLCDMFSKLREKAIYIGFPSLYGSCHAIEPSGCMAISSDSKNPDACWELISMIFDDDIQQLAV